VAPRVPNEPAGASGKQREPAGGGHGCAPARGGLGGPGRRGADLLSEHSGQAEASANSPKLQAVASASSSAKPRVLLGSTGMPGPIVVVKVTFFRYLPLAAAGLSLITSSSAAA